MTKLKHQRKRRAGGSVYLVVLGATMVVTVIGVSALLAVRVHRQAVAADGDAVGARLAAESMLGAAMLRIAEDPDWRTAYRHDEWTDPEPLGPADCSFKLIDRRDGDLASDPSHPVRLVARAAVGGAVRLHSVRLDAQPVPPPGLLTNPGFEDGTTGWSGYRSDIAQDMTTAHGGNASLAVTNRTQARSGPRQTVTSKLSDDTSYDTEVWVKMASGSADVRVTISLLLGLTREITVMAGPTRVGTQWTRVAGSDVEPNGLDLLNLDSARIWVETVSGTEGFHVDELHFVETGTPPNYRMRPATGTWRRDVLD